jgi:hypothetical protein
MHKTNGVVPFPLDFVPFPLPFVCDKKTLLLLDWDSPQYLPLVGNLCTPDTDIDVHSVDTNGSLGHDPTFFAST